MKKLYRKGTVHPSPPNKLDQLNFLPAAILTLASALSSEEKEVLAYLISCSNSSGNSFSNHHLHHRRDSSSSSFARSNTTGTGRGDHPLSFKCDCFRCYMSYWARWDSSPNRQLIHEIIEAFEDWLVQSAKQSSKKSRKDRKKKGTESNNSNSNTSIELKRSETSQKDELGEPGSVIESSSSGGGGGDGEGGSSGGGDCDDGEGEGKGSVNRLMNFIGERIWGVWGSSI